jgi:transposase-like protein
MGRKAKYTFEQKRKAVEEYLTGKKSAAEIACELEMRKDNYIEIKREMMKQSENDSEK